MSFLQNLNNDVHIWITQLNISQQKLDLCLAMLSDDEKSRCNKFVYSIDRNRFIASHGFIRQILGKYLSHSPHEINFGKTTFGKPYLISSINNSTNSTLQFNLSHSHNLAILAICNKNEVGVDIEFIKPSFKWEDIVQEFFTPTEQQRLFSLPHELQKHAFFQTWTRKESYMKVTGQGLHLCPTSFQVSIPPENAKLLTYSKLMSESVLKQNWTMQDLYFDVMDKEYCACLSVEKYFDHLQLFTHT